jgi:hypothetical protein
MEAGNRIREDAVPPLNSRLEFVWELAVNLVRWTLLGLFFAFAAVEVFILALR